MSLNDFLNFFTQATFTLIALAAVIDLARNRDQARLDIALVFGSLALAIMIQITSRISGFSWVWLSILGACAVMAHPYFLLRVAGYLQPIPRFVQRLSFSGLLVSWTILILIASPLPVWGTLALVVYFVLVEGYVGTVFFKGAFTTTGVTRQRLILASTATGLLALGILLAGILVVLPNNHALGTSLIQLLAILSGLIYYVAFSPPHWLRQAWQLEELNHFLRETAGRSASERASTVLKQFQLAASRAVSGLGTLLARWDESEQRWTAWFGKDEEFLSSILNDHAQLIQRARSLRKGFVYRIQQKQVAEDSRILVGLDVQAVVLMPIMTGEKTLGLLLIWLRHAPLFEQDDLNLLTLLAEQCAIALDYAAVLNEQQTLINQLKSVNDELEAFAYSVSHDLRAPLRSIDGFSLALQDDYGDKLDAQAQNYIQRVRAATQNMAQLIDDLLNLSRVTRSELKNETVDLTELAQSIAKQLTASQPARQVEFVIEPMLVTTGDPQLLRVALENLLNNAWKFTSKQSHARIEFGTQQYDDGRLEFYVRDNGAGFEMAYADKLFGAFQRLHSVKDYPGTGIGLATVKRIIHRHGGQIYADGRVNQGATFYFTLS